jgi:SAM-dependent methyltransferase
MRIDVEQPLAHVIRRAWFASVLALSRLRQGETACPYCASSSVHEVDRKFLVLEVRRCDDCGLMFRYPKATRGESTSYYQSRYCVNPGGGTNVAQPGDCHVEIEAIPRLRGAVWDATDKLRLISQLARGKRLLDFGCSWGYHMAQAEALGFKTIGYEIGKSRADYGRRLGLEILDDFNALVALPSGSLDVVFTSHTLEHMPSLSGIFPLFHRLLAPDGLLSIFVPNCGGDEAKRLGVRWGPFSTEAHTISFDAKFFTANLPKEGFEVRCFSDPYPSDISKILEVSPRSDMTRGNELAVFGRRSAVREHQG